MVLNYIIKSFDELKLKKKSSDSLSADNGDHLSVGFQIIVI